VQRGSRSNNNNLAPVHDPSHPCLARDYKYVYINIIVSHTPTQVVIVMTDGTSEDPVDSAAKTIHQKLGARVAAVGLRSFRKEHLLAITGYESSVFLLHSHLEAVSNWLLNQQRMWLEMNDYNPVVYGYLPVVEQQNTTRNTNLSVENT
jgi:hypothetical protein